MLKKILFVGAGNMGYPMIQNLARVNRFEIYAFDTNKEVIKKLASQVKSQEY